MNHYFSEDNQTLKSNPKQIAFRVNDVSLKFKTDNGVFSKDSLDRGTEVLLKYLALEDTYKSALDLGTGYGVVGVYLNKAYGTTVDMVDVNERALALAKENLQLNNASGSVYKSNGLDEVSKTFDFIVTNPPIRAGKEVVHRFFEDSYEHLNNGGSLYVVINKKHGAASAVKKLESIYNSVELLGRSKGFHVLKCKKCLTIWRHYDIILNCQNARFFAF